MNKTAHGPPSEVSLSLCFSASISVSAVSVSLCHHSKEDVSRIIQSLEDLKRTER